MAANRSYGRIPAAQRSRARRAQLLEATLDIVGSRGYGALTVSGLCRTTGLNDRYFYEHFANRNAVFMAVVEQIADETMATNRCWSVDCRGRRERSDPRRAACRHRLPHQRSAAGARRVRGSTGARSGSSSPRHPGPVRHPHARSGSTCGSAISPTGWTRGSNSPARTCSAP